VANGASQMDPKQPVNFYFGGLAESGLLAGASSTTGDKASTSYLIIQNNDLHQKVRNLEVEINELSTKVQELEDENESFDSKNSSLKGYIKNEGEFNRLAKNLIGHYDKAIGTIPKLDEEIRWNVKYMGAAFVVLQVCLLVYKLYTYDFLASIEMLVMNGIIVYITTEIYKPYCDIVKIRNIRDRSDVQSIRNEMKRAMVGNDYLNQLVDRL